ncbi:uncharacterized protein BYT42DRAFT_615697 [Radiomyces spectabilis]|uniref:uncharacterized protein n=1 Tax=Radiomyces spectabilis TaxID=64574 RepID=UPI00221EA5CB|nr:uncharacterized protein BYT42DRAFT_615697 [Radiomyces spectabilis]KAI8374544.1 hypothetical protein BYT42DRAFT_615697 [Radiomyces spectabilis]
MPHKHTYEPKDPRIIDEYEDDLDSDDLDLDDWSLTGHSNAIASQRKRKTGTQALVEFLNNTSPEEFQKRVAKRTPSTLFFRLRRNKQAPSVSTISSLAPNVVHRKNYIEIVAGPTSTQDTSGRSIRASKVPSFTSSSLRHSVVSQESQTSPMLPVNRSSSRWADSLRGSMSIRSRASGSIRTSSVFREINIEPPTTEHQDTKPLTDRSQHKDMAMIETALAERLEQFRLAGNPTLISNDDVVPAFAAQPTPISQPTSPPKKVRHMQVQTATETSSSLSCGEAEANTEWTDTSEECLNCTQGSVGTSVCLEELQMQLVQEQQLCRQLEANMENACDQFEALSGLAYKRLRELWEEKTRWENAYMTLLNHGTDNESETPAHLSP